MMKNDNEILRACSKCGGLHKLGEKCSNYHKDYTGQYNNRSDVNAIKIRSSTKWQKKRQEIQEHANFICEYCFEHNRLTYNDLSVHHIEKLEDNPGKAYDNYNLILLCKYCHKLADSNKIDAEELKKIAKDREFLS